MITYVPFLLSMLWAADPQPSADSSEPEVGETAEEPEGGTGVSPVELIPRIELRQSYANLSNGVSVSAVTTESDLQIFPRMLLRYELPLQVVSTGGAQVSGLGDVRLETLVIVASDKTLLLAVIGGVTLDTATRPQLGAGKQQLSFGGGAAIKPRRWWLGYVVGQEQVSVGGNDARPDVNQLSLRVGNIVFGKRYTWFKMDLDTTVDFLQGEGRFFGTLEAGSLLIGRVGLFVRSGTQLLGERQVDYSLATGFRYLFRLEKPKPR